MHKKNEIWGIEYRVVIWKESKKVAITKFSKPFSEVKGPSEDELVACLGKRKPTIRCKPGGNEIAFYELRDAGGGDFE